MELDREDTQGEIIKLHTGGSGDGTRGSTPPTAAGSLGEEMGQVGVHVVTRVISEVAEERGRSPRITEIVELCSRPARIASEHDHWSIASSHERVRKRFDAELHPLALGPKVRVPRFDVGSVGREHERRGLR
jgi:hypothetical protein